MGIHILFFTRKVINAELTFIHRIMRRWIYIWYHPWHVWFNSAIRRPGQSAPRYYQTYKIYLRVWRMWKWEFSSRWIHNFLCKQKCFKSCRASPYLLSARADTSRLAATEKGELPACLDCCVDSSGPSVFCESPLKPRHLTTCLTPEEAPRNQTLNQSENKLLVTKVNHRFPWRLSGKECACQAGDRGLNPGSERSSGEGNGNPLQYSCLGNPMDRGAWRAIDNGVERVGHDLVTKQ